MPFGIPRCVVAALFALAYASRRATFCHKNRPICHFELVSKSVLFFLWFHQGNTLCFQSVARQIPYLRGCREPFYPQPIPLGQKARGSKGARPPSPEVKTSSKSRTRRSWRIFGDFLFVRKSPGCRAERLHQEAQELPAPQNPGRGTERPLIGECRGGLAPSQRSCYPGPRQWPKSKRRRERNPFPASPSRGFFLI